MNRKRLTLRICELASRSHAPHTLVLNDMAHARLLLHTKVTLVMKPLDVELPFYEAGTMLESHNTFSIPYLRNEGGEIRGGGEREAKT